MKIAVEGCMHGDMDNVYTALLHMQNVDKIKIDLLICCGDFQAVRNEKDLESLNVPRRYRRMNSFYKYFSGEKVAPFPTIFIGGNHEASNYLWELYYGGWAAPQIYFLGIAGVIKFGNVRIGGLSGIYKEHDYYLGHYEKLPYNENDIRSIYHVREFDVYKLMQVEEPIDIFISHDWPLGVTAYGNLNSLLRHKPFFEQEIEEGTLGNPAAMELLGKLKPSHWFSAHLHCKFSALVQHSEDGSVTKFLALDKCLPRRKFLQIVDIPSEVGPYELQYDEEWLAITRKFNPAFPRTRHRANFSDAKLDIRDCRQFVRNKLHTRGAKPFQFIRTAPCYNPGRSVSTKYPFGHCRNPQTEALLQLLELQYILDDPSKEPSQTPELFPSRGMEGSNSACEGSKGKKNEKGRRTWSTKEEEALLAALKDLVRKGLKSENGFRAGYLMALEESMKTAFPGTDIRGIPHINSKIHVWKKNYGSLFTILSTSGIGWNESDKMIDAPDDDWATLVKIDPNARGMRTKSWPYYDDWCEIFGKDRATGHNAEGFVEAVQEILSQTQAHNGADIDIGLNNILHSDFEDDVESISTSKPNLKSSEKKISKKRKSIDSSNDNLIQAMKQFSDRTDARLGEIAKCLITAFDVTDATNDVFEALDCFSWLTVEAKVFVAKKLVNNPQELKLFFKLPDDAKAIMVKMLLP